MAVKGCPFCGEEPYVEYTEIEYGRRSLDMGYVCRFICPHDGCTIKAVSQTDKTTAYARALKKWNTRVEI